MTITFQTKIVDDKTDVSIGKWAAVPTGPWCALKRYINKQVCTPPVMGNKRVSWLSADFAHGYLHLTYYTWTLARSYVNRPFKDEEARWSVAESYPKVQKSTSSIKINDEACYNGQRAIAWLGKLGYAELVEAKNVISSLTGPCTFVDLLNERMDAMRALRSTKGKTAAVKSSQTRESNKAWGNPKRFAPGDLVVSTYPMEFKSGRKLSVFYYTPSASYPKGECKFYAMVDENGLGIGSAYKATKKYLRRVCPPAFEEATHFSSHERLALIQHQIDIETKRAMKVAEECSA